MAYFRCGGGGLPSTVKILPTISSASGSVATFNTDLTENLIKCVSAINAEQASGTPTPSSPIPITGHSSCVIKVKDGNDTTQKTVTVSLGQTVYGGTLDVTTGVLTITHAIEDMGNLSWTYNSTRVAFNTTLTGIKLPSGADVPSNLVSDSYKTETAVSSASAVTSKPDYSILQQVQNATVFVKNSDYTNGATFQTAMTGVKIVYELATATTVQLSSEQIETLLGTNKISSSTGDVDIEYLETVGHKEDLPQNPLVYKNYAKFNGEGIILPWKLNSDYKIEVVFYETTYRNDACIIGNSYTSTRSHLTEYSNKYYTSTGSSEGNFGTWSSGEHTFINNNGNNHNEFDGVEVTNYTPATDSGVSYTIGCRVNLTSNAYYGWIKSYKIYSISNGTLLHDLRPAEVLNQACLFDVVEKRAYYANNLQAVDTIS